MAAAQLLRRRGWASEDARYWTHERYGPAVFDTWEAEGLEKRRGVPQPLRAPACRCAHAIADQGTCVKCGRRVC